VMLRMASSTSKYEGNAHASVDTSGEPMKVPLAALSDRCCFPLEDLDFKFSALRAKNTARDLDEQNRATCLAEESERSAAESAFLLGPLLRPVQASWFVVKPDVPISLSLACEMPQVRNHGTNATSDVDTIEPSCSASDSSDVEASESAWTTLIMKNIPTYCNQDMLLLALDREGFRGFYDFVYLPRAFDKPSAKSFRYAFVNCTDTWSALRLRRHFEGFRDWRTPMDESDAHGCCVSWSHGLQGLAMHVGRYRNSPVMHPTVNQAYKPAIFQNGVRGSFPPPIVMPKAPRLRRRKTDVDSQ